MKGLFVLAFVALVCYFAWPLWDNDASLPFSPGGSRDSATPHGPPAAATPPAGSSRFAAPGHPSSEVEGASVTAQVIAVDAVHALLGSTAKPESTPLRVARLVFRLFLPFIARDGLQQSPATLRDLPSAGDTPWATQPYVSPVTVEVSPESAPGGQPTGVSNVTAPGTAASLADIGPALLDLDSQSVAQPAAVPLLGTLPAVSVAPELSPTFALATPGLVSDTLASDLNPTLPSIGDIPALGDGAAVPSVAEVVSPAVTVPSTVAVMTPIAAAPKPAPIDAMLPGSGADPTATTPSIAPSLNDSLPAPSTPTVAVAPAIAPVSTAVSTIVTGIVTPVAETLAPIGLP